MRSVLGCLLAGMIVTGVIAQVKAEDPTRSKVRSSAIEAHGVTIPAGILFGSFAKEDGPFTIEGSVVVPSGQTLEFGPGCTVYVGGEYSTITVFGQFVARGTAKEPVVFMSARPRPNPWDWDRIYCRSKSRSIFEHCIIRNSNYGIVVDNGAASITNCRFERNSIHGLVVRNSDVTIRRSSFENGQVLALLCEAGSVVHADSLVVRENISGIACDNHSEFFLSGGDISHNINGITVLPDASVTILGAVVSNNRIGVISDKEIPRRFREMVYGNVQDMKIEKEDELQKILKGPENVKSIVLPSTPAPIGVIKDFRPGFSANGAPQETQTSFIGNVTTGFTVNVPHSFVHPVKNSRTVYDTTRITADSIKVDSSVVKYDTLIPQTKYPGEQSNKFYSGILPDIQIFASGKSSGADVNLLADLVGSQWYSTSNYIKKNIFNLSMNYNQQSLTFGDFFESGSEISIAGREVTGLKFTGSAFDLGGGARLLDYKLAAGMTEMPKDSGFHQLDIYNTDVDTGMSVRQQITYIAAASIKPTQNTTLGAQGVIAHDQTNTPLFSTPISDPQAPKPVEAQTGSINGSMLLFDGALGLNAEVALGTHDTLDTTANVAWYNPEIEKAIPKVFGLLNQRDFTNYYAAMGGAQGNLSGYQTVFTAGNISQNYFSAGNPYLEADRRFLKLTTEKPYSEKFTFDGEYDYERTSKSTQPLDRNTAILGGKYVMGGEKPELAASYTLRTESSQSSESSQSPESADSLTGQLPFTKVKIENMISVEDRQSLNNGVAYTIRYQFLWDDDASKHANPALKDIDDGMEHEVGGWFEFKLMKFLKNKTTLRLSFKNQNLDSLRGVSYKVADQLALTPIPRKLDFTLSGELNNKVERRYEDETWLDPVHTWLYAGELESKYSITPRFSVSVLVRYERSYDETIGSAENYSAKICGLHLTYLF